METPVSSDEEKVPRKRDTNVLQPYIGRIITFTFVIILVVFIILFVIKYPEKVFLLILVIWRVSYSVARILRATHK
jgi:magnesium-transporting ATPase (P-type)